MYVDYKKNVGFSSVYFMFQLLVLLLISLIDFVRTIAILCRTLSLSASELKTKGPFVTGVCTLVAQL